MKQKTLEEIKPKDIQRIISSTDAQTASIEIVKLFSKWQQERSYSEEEVLDILDHHTSYLQTFIAQYIDRQDMEVNEEWFKQFKRK